MLYHEKFQSQLFNIEAAIIDCYRRDRDISDYDVLNALEVIISDYRAKQIDREPKSNHLQNGALKIHRLLTIVCDWMLSEEKQKPGSCEWLLPKVEVQKIGEIIRMLKYIKKSVEKWNKRGGRQGYLNLVEPYILTDKRKKGF